MHSRTLEITAPSRLHFGLFSFGGDGSRPRQFGGVGVMIESPRVKLRATAADHFTASGDASESIHEFAERFSAFHDLPQLPKAKIDVLASPHRHVGLGSGTQLALSTARLLAMWEALPTPSPPELANSVGRGLRSAVGAHGFFSGGLIVERGKTEFELLSPLEHRAAVPEAWRFVLVRPTQDPGLSGAAERRAFASLPPVPRDTTEHLRRIANERIAPAVESADFHAFSESVYDYGQTAGSCFATIQGGPYNGEKLTKLVEIIRNLGVAGVGQSSWGPTLFAILPDQPAAEAFVTQLAEQWNGPLNTHITQADNQGACVIGE